MHIIELQSVTKKYDNNYVIKNLDLKIGAGEFWTLLGPSGCGKTTLLRIIGGFEEPDTGKVLFNGRDITKTPPYKREINTVFQRYALFPHLNVYENIAFGLEVKKIEKKEIENKVKDVLSLVGLSSFSNRDIASLSGGQQQRVAIARALINEPKVLLLDESLSALDYKLRKSMQIELKNIQEKLDITFIFVTHDQEEALTMSDKVVVINNGEIQQVGKPEDIYNEPENRMVAEFIGESNILDVKMEKDYLINFEGLKIPCIDKGFNKGELVEMLVRPEDVELVKEDTGYFNGIIESTQFKGVHYEMFIRAKNYLWKAHSTELKEEGKIVGLKFLPENIHIMRK